MIKKSLSKIIPYKSIDANTGLILNGNGDVTKLYRFRGVEVFTQDFDSFNKMNDELSNVLKTLPKYSMFHYFSFVYPSNYLSDFTDANSYTVVNDLRYWNLKPILEYEQYIAITLSERKNKPKGKQVGNTVFNLKDYLFSNEPFKWLDKIESYVKVFESFEQNFITINGLNLEILSASEVSNVIYRYLTLEFDYQSMNDTPVIGDIVVDNKGFMLGDKDYKVISMVKQGSEVLTAQTNEKRTAEDVQFGTSSNIELPVSYCYPLDYGLSIPHIFNISIDILDNDICSKVLNTGLLSHKILASLKNQKSVNILESTEKFIDKLFKADLQSVNLGMNVIIASSSEKKLELYENKVKSAFTKLRGTGIFVESLEAFPAFMYSLPGNRKDYSRNLVSTTGIASAYIPKESKFVGDEEGFYFLDRYGKPGKLNMWHGHKVNNVNMVIVGPSGSGKSFSANTLLHKMNALAHNIVIIDVGHSYRETCAQLNGRYFDSDEKETLGVNIFSEPMITGDDKLDNETLTAKRDLIFAVIKTIIYGKKGIANSQRQALKNLISNYYDSSYGRSSHGFYEYIKHLINGGNEDKAIELYLDLDELYAVFTPFVKDEYAWVFNQSDSYGELDAYNFVVFSLKSIESDETVYPIYSLILIEQILGKIRRLPIKVRKSFLIDEAWSILSGDMAPFVEYLIRTIRKENGQLGLITQSANDIVKSDMAAAIKINTDIKIILPHKEVDESVENDLRNGLGLNSGHIDLLKSLKSTNKGREMLVVLGSHGHVVINENSPESYYTYTTHPDDLARLTDLKSRGLSTESAIDEIVYLDNKA